jgi:hypothetical protein
VLAVFIACLRKTKGGSEETHEAAGALTTFYNSGAGGGNFLPDLDVCSRAVCSEAQSGNSRCDKSW